MKLHKYHSCENYFLITDFIDNIEYDILSKRLCDKYSVDGMIFVKMDPVQMYFYNKDGSKAKMCGNGIRTLMHYLYNRYGIYTHLDIKTDSGIYSCEILNKEPFVSSVSSPFKYMKKYYHVLQNKKPNILVFPMLDLNSI